MSHIIFEAARLAQQKAARRRKSPTRAALSGTTRLSPTQQRGRRAEALAAKYLQQHGVQILAQNVSNRMGEIDLIGWHRQTLLLIEVRYRRHALYGGAIYSVNEPKQQRLLRCASLLLPTLQKQLGLAQPPACRFDLVAIQGKQIQWLQHIFVSE